MRSELCNRCGSCVGLSGGKIIFNDREGKYLPKIISKIDDKTAQRLWTACSGKDFNFPEYNKYFYKESSNFHEYIGSYQSFYIGYSNDEQIRKNAASGGIISAILIYLLEKKLIDGAVTLRMSYQKP